MRVTGEKRGKMKNINELKKKIAALESEYGVKFSKVPEDKSEEIVIENKGAKVITIASGIKRSEQDKESDVEKAYMNEMVTMRLFKDNSRYKDDLYVAVNGENCVIKRGAWVKVKRKFAEVIDRSLIQDQLTGDFMESKAREFAKESVARNI